MGNVSQLSPYHFTKMRIELLFALKRFEALEALHELRALRMLLRNVFL